MCDCVRVCVAFISKGIHFPMGRRVYLFLMPLLLWIGTDRLWQSCCARSRCICSEILLLLFLLSCLFPLISHLSRSPHLSAPSLPLSPTRRADCVWGPQAEESSPGAGPHWEDPAPAWTCGAAARTHAAPGERWVNAHLHEPPHTSPPPALSFDLTSICFSFPQVLPPSLWLLMSSKMTSPPHPHPRSSTALTNHQLFLHCRGSQVTNYWATARLWSRPLTTVPVMLRWGNGTKYIVLIKTHIFWKKCLIWALSYNHGQTY